MTWVVWKPLCAISYYILWYVTWSSKMAENSKTVVKMARSLAVVHIIVGFLMICCGIAETNLPDWGFLAIWIFIAISFGFWVSYEYSQKLDS